MGTGLHRRVTLPVALAWVAAIALPAPLPAAATTLVVLAPHPDDAEASCGGLIANTVAAGGTVTIITMTGGELGIAGRSPEQARGIRTAEARKAAKDLGASVEFLGAVDASLPVDAQATRLLGERLLRLHADIVVAPWPLDVHADHQATGLLAWRVFQDRGQAFALYFYETSNAPHTMSYGFEPSDFVDITQSFPKKRLAVFEHASQDPAAWFDTYVTMARFRGLQADVPMAEGYLRARNSSGMGGRAAGTTRLLAAGDPGPAQRHDSQP
jgi:LmbE family N-acetylglucosaminyl deacetylase